MYYGDCAPRNAHAMYHLRSHHILTRQRAATQRLSAEPPLVIGGRGPCAASQRPCGVATHRPVLDEGCVSGLWGVFGLLAMQLIVSLFEVVNGISVVHQFDQRLFDVLGPHLQLVHCLSPPATAA